MSAQRSPTRQRIINAAIELFTVQGITDTTTRQIAELAEVNEVTLFRHFGNKHGILLAVLEDSAMFNQLGESLIQQANQTSNIAETLKNYANSCLQALERVPDFVRSVVGEAGQYPAENRQALGEGLTAANQYVAQYLATVIHRGQLQTHLPAEKLASLLNGMLLGYAVIEFTSEFHQLWESRDDFLNNLVELFLNGAVSQHAEPLVLNSSRLSHAIAALSQANVTIAELPTPLVHSILQQAKSIGAQAYAIAYVLFAAGLSPAEVVGLQRSHQIADSRQHLLQVMRGGVRQVPVNQWILGDRYGTYTRNPLTQWLKSRKDPELSMFMNAQGKPLSEANLRSLWQDIVGDLLTPTGRAPQIEQAQQTWCIEMLMRGMTLEDLSILTGWDQTRLQPYAQRAREKTALEQAIRLDQKP